MHSKLTNKYNGYTGFSTQHIFNSIILLGLSNFLIVGTMFLVYCLGKDTIYSDLLIYSPIILILTVLVRDKFTFSFTFSCLLALLHGLAHKFYPFLDENIGVNTSIDVWQDQILHLGQAILFSSLYYKYSNNLLNKIFGFLIIGNIVNVILGFFCWGQKCHNLYVWVSLLPALASGLHFATGSLYHTDIDTATCGFLIQSLSSIITYFIFKGSDDILKLFALCRFFEIYFIVPHYIGFFNSRYVVTKNTITKSSKIKTFLQILGIYSIRIIENTIPYLTNYFSIKYKKV